MTFSMLNKITNIPINPVLKIIPLSKQDEKFIQSTFSYLNILYGYPKVDDFKDIFDTNFILKFSAFPNVHTISELTKSRIDVHNALTDIHISKIDIVIVKDNWVFLRLVVEGTHNGEPLNGYRATNRHAEWPVLMMFEFNKQNGKLKAHYKETDMYNMKKIFGWE